jgi:hypothetical protein
LCHYCNRDEILNNYTKIWEQIFLGQKMRAREMLGDSKGMFERKNGENLVFFWKI